MTAATLLAICRLLNQHPSTTPEMASVTFSVTHTEDVTPRIIHIYNLDEGQRDIVLPHMQSESDDETHRPIRIFNAQGERVREVAQPRE